MASRFLLAVVLAVASTSVFAQVTPPTLAAIRAQMANAGVDGRFNERFAGSYVFTPLKADWPDLPVENPEQLGALAIGPPVRVRGQVDDNGHLTVGNTMLRPGQPQSAWVKSATTPLVKFLESAVARQASAMDEELRTLSLPSDRQAASDSIAQIVSNYKQAWQQHDDVKRRALVEEWANWRAAFVDAFSDSLDAKAIYGALDNYPHWRYDIIFRQAASVVAIGEPGASRSRCSGVLIAPDLVLTAAHCFSGSPKKFPKELEAWFGYFSTSVPGTVAPFTRRAITEIVSPPPAELNSLMQGVFSAAMLDYAIVRIAAVVPDAAPPAPECVRKYEMQRGEALYVFGYPLGNPVMVHDSARVYLPYRVLDDDEFVRLRLDVEADVLRLGPEATDLMLQFDASYKQVTIDGAPMRELRHVRDNGQPRMGIVADTFRGNSGGPVFDHERNQCVAGILVGGATDTGLRRTPNWKEHERVLPMTVILEDLQKRKLDSVYNQLSKQ